jgi:hypothetical protein
MKPVLAILSVVLGFCVAGPFPVRRLAFTFLKASQTSPFGIGTTGSRVPQQSLIRIHAASKPDAARAGLQDSARTRPRGHYHPPGFDIIQ